MTDQAIPLQQEEKQFSLAKDAFIRLVANRLAIVGMVLVAFLFFVAIFGPYLTPYDFLSQDLMARNQPP